MNRLQNKVAIITGGAHGIGAALVQRFSEEGARVVSVDVNREGGEKVAQQFGATFKVVDVSDHNAIGELVTQTVRDFGRLDCVVSNACMHSYVSAEETPPALWDKVIAINLSATYHLVHHAAPHLRKQPGASIVIISSVQAIQGFKNAAAYATSKGGQLSLMRQLANDLAPDIRVNAILPGTIRSYPESLTPEFDQHVGSLHMLGRIGECVEVANGAVFLAVDGKTVTGDERCFI